MNRKFCRRQRKDEPTAPGIDCTEIQNIVEECAIGIGILAVKENVRTVDHEGSLS